MRLIHRAGLAALVAVLAAAVAAPPAAQASRASCRSKPVTLRCAAERAGVRVGVGREVSNRSENLLTARQFNAMTLEGSLLWSVVHPEPRRWEFSGADRSIAWARRRHLLLSVTHFVWDQILYQSTPAWVKQISTPATLRRVMYRHLRTITRRYGRGTIDRWITVNEPLRYLGDTTKVQDNHFSRVLGADWIAETFRIAHRAAPGSELWLNEIFTETDAAKAAAFVRLARSLVAQGVPVDGVSIQGHLFTPLLQPVTPRRDLVRRTLRRLAALGLKVSITEIDAPTFPETPDRLDVQARRIRVLAEACLAVRRCTGLTFWNLHDGRSWLRDLFRRDDLAPTLFTSALAPKPAFRAVRAALLEAARKRGR
jgi:endo-1,4-beta-xylanase